MASDHSHSGGGPLVRVSSYPAPTESEHSAVHRQVPLHEDGKPLTGLISGGDWLHKTAAQLVHHNWVSVILVAVLVFSMIFGMIRGATGSIGRLMQFLWEGLATVLSIWLAWKLTADVLSPALQRFLASRHIVIPADLTWYEQVYYTMLTSLRDFSLTRFSVVFILSFAVLKQCFYTLYRLWIHRMDGLWERKTATGGKAWNTLIGAAAGLFIGAGRLLIFAALLFVFVTLYPRTPAAQYVQASGVYQETSSHWIAPYVGDLVQTKLPVFTRSVEREFGRILQKKYEVIDANIPPDIAKKARQLTAGDSTDKEKAKDLYVWVGTHIKYDWKKYHLYEKKQVWEEQTPEDTFHSGEGVCIDYSRLYASMARSVGLQVKIETGLGYDGHGGYGSHAWNVVYLSARKKWVPLDTTWESSGGQWFNPPDFYKTHIKET